MTTFAPAFKKQCLISGALDEWLSQRSAKPSTAVRIRQAPPQKREKLKKKFSSFFYFLPFYLFTFLPFYSFDSFLSSTLLIT